MRRRKALETILASAVMPTLGLTKELNNRKKIISEFLSFDPVENFRQAMRIQRSLEEEDDILMWYHFIMIAVPLNATPKPVVRWEGIELSRHKRITQNHYRIHGHNLSFPRSLQGGNFITEVYNPVSKKIVQIPPMALTSDPGIIRSPAGVITLDKPNSPIRPDYKVIRREGSLVKVDSIRVPPETWPVTFLEMGTESVSATDFYNESLKWLPSAVSGAYVFPWPKWMDMGTAPGHMFATWSGSKLQSIDELPIEYRKRAEKDYPELLQVDRNIFNRVIPNIRLAN